MARPACRQAGRNHKYMAYYVYLLQSIPNGSYYTGITSNLKRRLSEHNKNISIPTRGKGPYELVYYEKYLNRGDARKREKYFKSGSFRKIRENFLRNDMGTWRSG